MDLTQLLAQLQALGPLSVTGQPGAYSSEALQRLLPGARIQARQSHGHLGGDAAGFYDDPSQGYDVFQPLGDGRYLRGGINPDGTFGDLREMRDSDNIFDKIGDFALDYGPALVLAAATYGAGGLGSLTGAGEAVGAAPAASGGMPLSGLGATPSMVPLDLGVGGAELGSGTFGLDIASGSAAIPFGGLTGAPAFGTAGQIAGQMAVIPGAGVGMGGYGAGALGAAGAAASQPAVAPQAAAAVPGAKEGASLLSMDTLRTVAPLVGPAASLIQGATAQQPQMPQNAEARVPGVEAPPEARGLQAARAPILDVLGRNRRENRNRTMLTGPGGVSMESVRVGGNTLLGM